jgi:hypothetical protein
MIIEVHVLTFLLVQVNSLVVTNIALIASAVCVMVFPFCTTYPTFVVTALLFGFFVGEPQL